MKHDNNDSKYRLNRTRLTSEEIQRYREIGEPDFSQNWLELFTPTVISDLFEIMQTGSDNTVKAEIVHQELGPLGFELVGLGTNIVTLANPAYPGVVFKIALDENGIADNFNDAKLGPRVNEILGKARYTEIFMRDMSGIVSVQERKVLIRTQERMDDFRGSILKALDKLASEFLIVDLSPSLYHLNYGIERNGDWCFIDASDLYPLDQIKKGFRCQKVVNYSRKKHKSIRCGGTLEYQPDYSEVFCQKCGAVFINSELRPSSKEEKSKMAHIFKDGLSEEQYTNLLNEEIRAMKRREKGERNNVPRSTPTKSNTRSFNVLDQLKNTDEDEADGDLYEADDDDDSDGVFERVGAQVDADEEDDEETEAAIKKLQALQQEDETSAEVVRSQLQLSGIKYELKDDGIYLSFTGDIEDALDKGTLPLFMSFDDGETWTTGLNTVGMRKIFEIGVSHVLEDLNVDNDEDD